MFTVEITQGPLDRPQTLVRSETAGSITDAFDTLRTWLTNESFTPGSRAMIREGQELKLFALYKVLPDKDFTLIYWNGNNFRGRA